MNVPLLDLKAQYRVLKLELDAAIAEVMESQHFILGPKVKECEEAIARYSGCSQAVGVSSGTDALLACLVAEGIGPGDEVITTPYTFFATAGCIARTGATPIFADIDPVTYNIEPSQIEAAITPRTRAIIPVHLYGQMADMKGVLEIAERHHLIVIEDAAQAIGAEGQRHRAGSLGHYGCFSFFPSKNLGAVGDAGMIVTNDAFRADKLRRIRAHGSHPKYYHKLIGGNFRLDALQAAIISVKLRHLDTWTTARQRNAKRYDALFSETGLKVATTASYGDGTSLNPGGAATISNGARHIYLPEVVANRHIFNQYVIRVQNRDGLRDFLDTKGVATEIYYPVPMHRQECFAYLGLKEGTFPESEKAARQTLALPIYPELTSEQASYVVDSVREYFQRGN